MDDGSQQKKTVVPIRRDAKIALDQAIREMPGGATQIDLVTQLVLWFTQQPPRTKMAVLCVGAGLPVEDARKAKEMAEFGEGPVETRERASSADPTQSGKFARPAESRPAPRRATG